MQQWKIVNVRGKYEQTRISEQRNVLNSNSKNSLDSKKYDWSYNKQLVAINENYVLHL
jgi:hypothetical protein